MEYTVTAEVENRLKFMLPHEKMGVLGGTFNPIHNGHIDMALFVRREFDLKKVLLIPAGDPPHKEIVIPAQKRLHMVALVAYDHPELQIDDREVRREGASYTIDTMRELSRKNPETDYYFIIGSDSLFGLDAWKNIRELCRITRFVVVRRPGDDMAKLNAEIARVSRDYDAVIELSEHTGKDISSSFIRERVKRNDSIAGLTPPAVEEYIYANRLYK